jgi:hypothetical protein
LPAAQFVCYYCFNEPTDTNKIFKEKIMAKSRAHLNHREPGFRPVGNVGCAEAFRELGRSSAASPHTPKKFKGTRTASKRRSLKEAY